MNISNSENSEMLLLVDQASLQKQQLSEPNATQQPSSNSIVDGNEAYMQLAQPYDNQQFVLQNSCEMDMESLDEVLTSQGINLEDGELSVIEQDGRQYLLLANVSVAQVLESSDVTVSASHYSAATLQCNQPLVVTTSAPSSVINSTYNPSTVSTLTGIPPITNIVHIQPVPAPTQVSLSNARSIVTTTTSNHLDIHRIVPSLCPDSAQSNLPVQLNCPVCGFVADSEVALDDHMQEHRNELSIEKNSKKAKAFSLKKRRGRKKRSACRLIRTVAYTNPVRKGPFLCSVCGIQLPMLSVYKQHMKEHMNDKEFKCVHCSESFNIESNLKLHQILHSDFSEQQDKGHRCPLCPRVFTRVASLKAHLPLHYQDEIIICPECGDEFTSKWELSCHMAQHKMDLQAHMEERSEGFSVYEVENIFKTDMDYTLLSFPKKRRRRKKGPGFFQQCMYCEKVFRKESLFKRHVLIHTGERPFSCDYCEKTFNQAAALKMHRLIHTGEKSFACPFCPQVYSQKTNLKVHLKRAHSPSNNYKCSQCSCTFQKLSSLHHHITRSHSNRLLAVIKDEDEIDKQNHNVFAQRLNSKSDANKDVDVIQQLLSTLDEADLNDAATEEMTSDIVEQALQDCGVGDDVQSGDASVIPSNQELTTNSESIQIDNMQGGDIAMMTNHSQSSEEPNLDSLLPSSDLSTAVASSTGKGQEGPSPPGIYVMKRPGGWEKEVTWRVRTINGIRWNQCMFCPKEFKKPSDLTRHIRTHTNERPYTCKTCNKSFAVKTTLAVHEKTHLGYKPHKCMVCLKSFSTSGSLKIHHRLHTGALPFKCNHCDRKFRTSGHRHQHVLSAHVRANSVKRLKQSRKKTANDNQALEQPSEHDLEEPIRLDEDGVPVVEMDQPGHDHGVEGDSATSNVCSVCGKGFKRACHLLQHHRVHTGEKPYVCTQCGGAFATASILKAHLRVHSGYKPFRCNKCNLSFSSRFSLNRHMTSHSQSRPFMCPYCKKLFKTKGSCKKHIKVHKKDIKKPSTVSRAVDADSTIDTTFLFPLDHVLEEENHSEQRKDCTGADSNLVPAVPADCLAQSVASISSLPDPLNSQMELTPDAVPYQTSSALDQENMEEIPNVMPSFGDSIDLNVDGLAAEQERHDNQTADLNNQFYQVDQLLNFKCSGCSKYFETKTHLQRHQYELDLKKTNFQCSICNHSLESLASLTSHVSSHSQEMAHKCPVCFIGFHDASVATAHRLSHFPVSGLALLPTENQPPPDVEKPPQPSSPSAVSKRRKRTGFYRLSKEQSEMLQQTDPDQKMSLSEKILLASVAEKGRVRLDKFMQILRNAPHQQVIQNSEPVSHAQKPGTRGRYKPPDTNGPVHKHSCEHCPKSFRKKCDLTRHIRTHTGDKPYQCVTCGKSFAVKSALTCHEKIHFSKKLFRCHICNHYYSSKTSLKVHMRLHSGSTPYTCPHCPALFSTPSSRKHHVASHFGKTRKTPKRVPNRSSKVNKPQAVPVTSVPTLTPATTIVSSATTTPGGAVGASAHASTPSKGANPTLVWPDMTITVPIEGIPVLQDADSFHVPGQVQNANMQIDGSNITLQIHPSVLQSLQESHTTLKVNAVNSQANTWPVQNMLLQPISALGIHAMSNHNAGNAAEAIGVQAIVNKETSADFVSLDAAQSMNAQLESAQAITDQPIATSTISSTHHPHRSANMVIDTNDILSTQAIAAVQPTLAIDHSNALLEQQVNQVVNDDQTTHMITSNGIISL